MVLLKSLSDITYNNDSTHHHGPVKAHTRQAHLSKEDRKMKRRRLRPQQRRDELLDVGAALFAQKPYDEVLMGDIADRAGVTRSLMYHYFPTKRDFYVGIFQRASDRLLASTEPHETRSLSDQLRAGLNAHIQYFVDHPREAVTVNRGALSDDPAIQAIITEELGIIGRRLVEGLDLHDHAHDVAVLAVHGWLVFVRAVCVEWIQTQKISRTELTQMCLHAFAGAVAPAVDLGAALG
jgi:AcrR family transcriptional regulator